MIKTYTFYIFTFLYFVSSGHIFSAVPFFIEKEVALPAQKHLDQTSTSESTPLQGIFKILLRKQYGPAEMTHHRNLGSQTTDMEKGNHLVACYITKHPHHIDLCLSGGHHAITGRRILELARAVFDRGLLVKNPLTLTVDMNDKTFMETLLKSFPDAEIVTSIPALIQD